MKTGSRIKGQRSRQARRSHEGEYKNERRSNAQESKSPDRDSERAVHSIWSGTISFSLVAIPVQLVRAAEPGRVSFRMLHSKDYSPLQRRMFCPREGKIVSPDEIARGYEIAPEKYIVVTDQELESVTPERSRTIEIIEFIDAGDVDLMYYDYPYYIIPSKGGEKAYSLLVEVLHRTKKAGLARFVLREREYLVAITSTEGALSLMTLHYSNEILSDEEIAPREVKIEPAEKNRLRKVVEKMIADFKPEKYANDRRKQIVSLLEKKAREKTAVEAPQTGEEEGESPTDLVAVLQESMRKVKKAG